MANTDFDVVIIGGGVVGCGVAQVLSGYDVRVALVEARGDVGDVTSKANTAILHTGFDCKPGTLESRLVARGYHRLAEYAASTGIPVEYTGAVLVAWTDEELDALPGLRVKAQENGYHACEIVPADEVYRMVPKLGPGVLGGLTVPDESIICTWTTTLAYAYDAKERGVDFILNAEVDDVRIGDTGTDVITSSGTIRTQWVINAAGLGSDRIDRLFGYDRFTVTPRRGELFVFDKLARPLVPKVVLPVPSSKGKGVLVSPTIYGNVMLGPTAEDMEDRTDTSTSEAGLAFLQEKGARLMPDLLSEEVTAMYAGLRAATEHGDYVVDCDVHQRYILLGGIRSTGLTASLALGDHVVELLADTGRVLMPRTDLPDPPTMPNIGEAFPRPYQREELIDVDPEYGHIVCFCERVSRGEIRDALVAPIPPCDLDGLRRRTRALMGRCQGFFCGAEVSQLMERA